MIIPTTPGEFALVGSAFRIIHTQRKHGLHGRVAAAAPVHRSHRFPGARVRLGAPATSRSRRADAADLRDCAIYRQLHKKVLSTRLLDDMSHALVLPGRRLHDAFQHGSPAGPLLPRIASDDSIGRVDGSGDWQDPIATLSFSSEDWRPYNRISVWVHPDVHGVPAVFINLTLHNEGAHVLPDDQNEGRDDSISLRNHAWNHVTWEIAPLDRDKITGLSFGYALPKMFPDPGDQSILYIDQQELQTVTADHVEGWDVSAGSIAFSQAGYLPGAPKVAVANGLTARSCSLVDKSTGKATFTGRIEDRNTSLSKFQVLDFSSVHNPGTYFLRVGNTATRPFPISNDVWSDSIWKTINFMYSERCGTVIPGIHGICHQDDYTVHGDQRVVVNGGYHDAGDLSATGNTPAMSYALFALADRLEQQGENSALSSRLIEEAEWGLNWVLKTRFGGGFRSTGQLISYWTDGIMGNADDRFGMAVDRARWWGRCPSGSRQRALPTLRIGPTQFAGLTRKSGPSRPPNGFG
jgi:hypothetical protein